MARAPRRHRADLLLRTALSLFGLGIVLLAMQPVLDAFPSPLLRDLAGGLAAPASLVLLGALVLGAVGYALKPRSDTLRGGADATLIPADSTDFVGTMTPPPEPVACAPHRGERPPARAWSAQVFDEIEWRRFQALCERLFAQGGTQVQVRWQGPEGSDLWLRARDEATPAAVVRCKPGRDHIVGVQQLRALHELVALNTPVRATYATPAPFTPDAIQFARTHGIETLDAEGLLERIARLPRPQQQALLAHAYEGEYWRPTCAHCGLKMVEHDPRGGTGFWGCADAPRCRFTLPLQTRA